MKNLKHVGQVINTGQRCVVVFREIYDERGHVIDKDSCLVFNSDSLPDAEHQALMKIVESENAQSTPELYNVLSRERLAGGMLALNWLVSTGRLIKFETSNILMTPSSTATLRLDKLNTIIRMQSTGASKQDIERVIQDDTDSAPREMATDQTADADVVPADALQTGEEVLDDSKLAEGFVKQAEMFEQQAKELREQALVLDPSLGPKKSTAKKKPANKKVT